MGHDYTLFSSQGRYYGVGKNDRGQLGLGNLIDAAFPLEIVALRNTLLLWLKGGFAGNLFSIYGWGVNDAGQLCLGHSMPVLSPTVVSATWSTSVFPESPVLIEPTKFHTLILGLSGSLYGCGLNEPSRRLLGIASPGNYSVPTRSALVTGKSNYVFATELNTAVISCLQNVRVWGGNGGGQIPSLASTVASPVTLPNVRVPATVLTPTYGSVGLGTLHLHVLALPSQGVASVVTKPVGSDGGGVIQFPAGSALSPEWTVISNNTRWSVQYAYEEVTPTGAVVASATVPGNFWLPIPYASNASNAFALLAFLDNCALAVIAVEFFNQTSTKVFAGQQLDFSAGQVKFTLFLSQWPYLDLRNSVRWTLRVSANATLPVTVLSSSLGVFSFVNLTDTATGAILSFRTLLKGLSTSVIDTALRNATTESIFVNAQSLSSGSAQLQIGLPAGCELCLIDPDMTIFGATTAVTGSSGLSPAL
jgi:hypothetical protein